MQLKIQKVGYVMSIFTTCSPPALHQPCFVFAEQHELYISLGIVPQRSLLEGKKGHPVHLDVLKKESMVTEIFTSTTREVTASPTWNETFEM